MQRALLVIFIAASYVLFAGSPRWTLIPLFAIGAATILVAPRRVFFFPPDTRTLDLALVAVLGVLVLQIVPLPSAVLAILSPQAESLKRAVSFGQSRGEWSTLSINPAASAEALAIVTLGVMSYWIARGVFSFGASTRQFCRWLAFLAGTAAVSGVLFRATMPGTVQGLIVPEARSASPFGAFVNRNHFAGWLLLASGPVCGYLIAHLRIHPAYRMRFRLGLKQFLASGALVIAIAALTIVGVMFLTLSRSAAAGLGCAAIFGWQVGRKRLLLERTNLPFVLATIGALLLGVVLLVDISGWTTRLEETFDTSSDRNRITIWRETLPVVRDFWLTGTGAGTYGDAMLRYQQSRVWVGSMNRWAHFNNAHSHYLQALAEGGLLLMLPLAIAAFALIRSGRAAVRRDKGEMQWARIGAAGALIGMAAQSIWETSLVLPANAVLFGALTGLLLYQRQRAVTIAMPSDTPDELDR